MAGLRVSPPRIFPEATRSSRPPAEAPGSPDAHRQTGFVLGEDLDVVLRGLNLEGAIAQASAGSKYRNQVVASILAFWSRSWLSRLQALHAVEWGNYASAFPLVRAAVDYQAAAANMLESEAAEWDEWLESGGITAAHEHHATEFRFAPFRSAETLVADDELGALYRAASDFAMPAFATTLTLAGSESSPQRVLVTFGDRDFHLALAEVLLGWLATLSSLQLRTIAGSGRFNIEEPDKVEKFQQGVRRAVDRRDRGRVEEFEEDGARRYLLHNWRRTPGSAAKRILL